MAYDNLCKSLVESNPRPVVTWLLGQSVGDTDITILKTELSVEPIRADFVSFLDVGNQILHLEFQTQADPEMPLRMLDYDTRLYRQYRRPIRQVVLFLRETNSTAVQVDYFETTSTIHRYQVIRLWEVAAQDLLAVPALWPLAVLAKSTNSENLLINVAQRLLQHKFGPLPEGMSQKIRNLSVAQLESLAEALFNLSSLSDVVRWLD